MIRLSFRVSFGFLVLFSVVTSFAQTKVITGRVRGEEGSPLPGVNITKKGTSDGTVTDADGNFTITVQDKTILVFSFIGYVKQEVEVSQESLVNVVLKMDAIYCGPTIEVGYGAFEERKIPFSAARLTSSDFNRGNIYESAQLWQGRVAGLSIYNRGGDPNVESFIRIRGMTSFDTNSKPLIVIDGVPAASLNNVDPNDIETISVLKDGATAAIYGMRGSAGVIEVVTKRGSAGIGISATYHGYTSASSVLRTQPLLSASEFVAAGGADAGFNTDWQDKIMRTGFSSAHTISLGGASNQSTFRASLNFRNVNGILLHAGFDQVNGRVGITHRALHDRLQVDFNMAFANRESNFSFSEAFRYIYFNPTAPVSFPNNEFYQAILFDSYNPVALLQLNTNRGKRKNINYNVKASYSITDNLTATVQYAQQFTDQLNGTYYSRKDFTRGLGRGGLAQRYAEQTSFSLMESYLSYFKQLSSTAITLMAGYSYQQDQFENLGIELGNFPNDELGYNALETSADRLSGQAALINIYSNLYPLNKLLAGFARVNINYADVWSFNFSIRRETSNRLGQNSMSGVFSSAATGVDLNKLWSMNFNALKARVSYGITGAFPSQPSLSQDLFQYQLENGGTVVQTRGANPDLKWEQKRELNFGVDFGFGRVSGSVDFYQRNTKDIILGRYLSDVGYNQFVNSGALQGRGFELSVQHQMGNYGSLQWKPGLVLSANRTVLDRYPIESQLSGYVDGPGSGSTQVVRLAVGEKLGQFWAPEFDRVDSNGVLYFKDLNSDGVVLANPNDALNPLGDFGVMGNAIPSLELGWSNQLKFRQWDLNTFFRGAFGHSLLNIPRLLHEPNDAGFINTYNQIRTKKAVSGILYSRYSSLYIEKADFLKLDNIMLGYNFRMSAQSKLRACRVYAVVQNAFVITNYSGVDPEPIFNDRLQAAVFRVDDDPLTLGLDRKGGYFPSRTFTIGLTLGL